MLRQSCRRRSRHASTWSASTAGGLPGGRVGFSGEAAAGADAPIAPPKGLALVDSKTYASMLPDEQFEANLFGFKVAIATTKSQQTVALA